MDARASKEAFVSGLSGTSMSEVTLLITVACLAFPLRNLLLARIKSVRALRESSAAFAVFLEVALVELPILLSFTVLADYALQILATQALLYLSTLVLSFFASRNFLPPLSTLLSLPYPQRLPLVAVVRTFTNLLSCVAILAVDFAVFPRRLAKTETYGTALMDTGVGLFLLSHAVVAPEVRGTLGRGAKGSMEKYVRLLLATLRGVFPLLVLGCLRVMAVKATGYQEHVTEYGVHWNFFFTITAVRLLCSLIHPLLRLIPSAHRCGILAACLSLLHQCYLSLWGGRDYVELGPLGDGSRPFLISANREGVVSCGGYLALYLAGIELGLLLFRRKRSNLQECLPMLFQLTALCGILWTLTVITDASVEPVSRKYANLAFILWMLSLFVSMGSMFLVADMAFLFLSHILHVSPASLSPLYVGSTAASPSPDPSDPSSPGSMPTRVCLISAVDYNQFFVFLLANVLTGLVNMAVDTLHASPPFALAVLLGYLACLAVVALALFANGIKIKL